METSWKARVETYVDELEQITDAIDSVLQKSRVDTSQVDAPELEKSIAELTHQLAALEEMVAEREKLLAAEDAPSKGVSLTEKLEKIGGPEEAKLASRCRHLAGRVSDTNHHAISLFVCQYHLADLSSEIIRLISGEISPPTYDASAGRTAQPKPTGGGLFNEAG